MEYCWGPRAKLEVDRRQLLMTMAEVSININIHMLSLWDVLVATMNDSSIVNEVLP